MTDKHLLWWVFKAIDAAGVGGIDRSLLLEPDTWSRLKAPDWVLPAMREKYAAFDA